MVGQKRRRRPSFAVQEDDEDDEHEHEHGIVDDDRFDAKTAAFREGLRRQMRDVWASCTTLLRLASIICLRRSGCVVFLIQRWSI